MAGLDLPFATKVVRVGAQNVSLSRNACLEAAAGDWLIFVDDDETVEPDWLEGHLSAARDFKADAVFGPVYPRYPVGTPNWYVAANPLFQNWDWHEDGRPSHRGRTGNTLIRRERLGDLRFDPAFGRSGGEDHDFFQRFLAAGHHMVVTDRAKVHEFVPAERSEPGYVLKRAVRTGQLYALMHLNGQGPVVRFVFALDAAAKWLAASLFSMVLRPLSRARSFRFRVKASMNVGKLRGAFNANLLHAWS